MKKLHLLKKYIYTIYRVSPFKKSPSIPVTPTPVATTNLVHHMNKENEGIMNEDLIVINMQTGEAKGELDPSEWARIKWMREKKETKAVEAQAPKKQRVRFKRFTIINTDCRDTLRTLSRGAMSVLVSMAMHLRYGTNLVVYKRRGDIVQRDISEMSGVSLGKISAVLDELEERNLIAREGKKIWVNPDVMVRGTSIPDEIKERFRDERRDIQQ